MEFVEVSVLDGSMHIDHGFFGILVQVRKCLLQNIARWALDCGSGREISTSDSALCIRALEKWRPSYLSARGMVEASGELRRWEFNQALIMEGIEDAIELIRMVVAY